MKLEFFQNLIKKDKERFSFSRAWEILFPIFLRYRFRLTAGFSALLIVDLLQLLIPRIIKYCVNGLADKSISTGVLLQMGGIIIAIAILVVLLRFCWRTLIIGFSRRLEYHLRNNIFSHVLKMDAPFFERYSTGTLMAHSSNDLAAVQMACGMGLVAAIDALVMSVAATGFMVTINFQLTCLALLPMPLLTIATRFLSKKLHRHFARVQKKFAELTEFSRTTLLSIKLIKASTMENFQTKIFDNMGRSYIKDNMRVAFIQGIITPFSAFTGSLAMLMVLYFGGRLVILETISIGDFVAFMTYLYMLIWPMIAIGWVINLMQRGLTSLDRVEKILSSQALLPKVPDTGQQISPRPTFSFHNASFTYPAASIPALSELNVEFGPGIHGITGHTGSGKSTLCKLLARLYTLNSGTLLIDDKDINQLPKELIHNQITYVSQEPKLFSDTIAANIGFGKPDATEQEIKHAAQMAAIEEDILALKDGYKTIIGERGVRLSGGQRQRIALARALLCSRPVLLIDDGLAAIDTATEHKIFQELQKSSYQTIILVSNRIKLLSITDRIHLLENGRLCHSGSHEELLAISSFYQTMHAKQMREESND